MIKKLNIAFFILALIYTLFGQLYLNKEQNSDDNTDDKDIIAESDNSTNAESYTWLIENTQSLSIGIITLGLFILFNIITFNNKKNNTKNLNPTDFPILSIFTSSMDKFMLSFNIIFIFYLSYTFYYNIIILLLYLSFVIFKHYCIHNDFTQSIKNVISSLCPSMETPACVFYWMMWLLIIINVIITPSNRHWVLIMNVVIVVLVLIFMFVLIYLLRGTDFCSEVFGIQVPKLQNEI